MVNLLVLNKKIFIGFFFISFILRFGLLITFKATQQVEQYDAKEYDIVAWNLSQGKGFIGSDNKPTQTRPPVYPIFLAAIYFFFGHNEFIAKFFQCIVDSFTVIIVMIISKKIFNPTVSLVSGIVTCFYPPLIVYSNIKLTECLFSFLVVSNALLLLKVFENPKTKNFIYLGISHGIMTLCRSTTAVFPFFLFLALLFSKLRKKLLKGFIVYFLVGSGIISIWTIRNYFAFHDFLLVNTGGGGLTWFAIQDDAWKGDQLVELHPFREFEDLKNLPWIKWEKIVVWRVIKFAIKHPLVYTKKIGRNFFKLWYLPVGKVLLSKKSQILATIYQIFHILLVLIALYGIILLRKNFSKILPILLYLIYLSVMHSILIAIPRYRLPFEPFVLIFFSYGLSCMARINPRTTKLK